MKWGVWLLTIFITVVFSWYSIALVVWSLWLTSAKKKKQPYDKKTKKMFFRFMITVNACAIIKMLNFIRDYYNTVELGLKLTAVNLKLFTGTVADELKQDVVGKLFGIMALPLSVIITIISSLSIAVVAGLQMNDQVKQAKIGILVTVIMSVVQSIFAMPYQIITERLHKHQANSYENKDISFRETLSNAMTAEVFAFKGSDPV